MPTPAPLNLGYWSEWITPPPMWVAAPFQKVPSAPVPPVYPGSTVTLNKDQLTFRPQGWSSSYQGEFFQLNQPTVFITGTQGSIMQGQQNRQQFTTFHASLGYYPNVTNNPPYGAMGKRWTPVNSSNYNLFPYGDVPGFEGAGTGYQWAYSWSRGADLSWTGTAEQKQAGTTSCLLTRIGTGANSMISIQSGSTYGFGNLTAGVPYTFEYWARAKINNPNMRVEVYDQLGNFFTSTYKPATQDWTLHRISFTPTVTRAYTFIIRMGSGALGDAVYVDSARVCREDIQQIALETVPVTHANRSFQYTFNVSSNYGALFDGVYWGYSGRPQFLWDWIRTGVRAPNAPYPEMGGYGGGYGVNYSADWPIRWLHTGNNSYGNIWYGFLDMRGRAAQPIYAGFYYDLPAWGSGSWVDPGTQYGYVGLQSGAQWFDWSGLADTSNWVCFHPSSLLGTTPLITCSYYDKLHYVTEELGFPQANQFAPYRVQFQHDDVQFLDSKLIFETSWLHGMSGVDSRPGYYYNNAVPEASPGHYVIYKDPPLPISTYITPVENNRGTQLAELHPSYDANGIIDGISWNSSVGITTYTFNETDMNSGRTAGYTHQGAEIGLDMLSLYPEMNAGFALHCSYAWNDPVDPNTFIQPVTYGGWHYPPPGCGPAESVSQRLHGSFEVLIQVQLPPFRYVIPWGTPAEDTVPDPMRLLPRDDGRGGYQGHSRIRTTGVNPSSAGLRIEGYNTYR